MGGEPAEPQLAASACGYERLETATYQKLPYQRLDRILCTWTDAPIKNEADLSKPGALQVMTRRRQTQKLKVKVVNYSTNAVGGTQTPFPFALSSFPLLSSGFVIL